MYLNVYGGESWPFLFIRYFEITELLKKCPKEIYDAELLDKGMLVHFYVAVHLLRIRQKKHVQNFHAFNVPLYKPYSSESKKSYEAFGKELSRYVPNLNSELLNLTTRFMLSVVIAFGSYSSIEKVPAFFYSDPLFKKTTFLDAIFAVYEEIDGHLSIPLSEIEKEKLLYSLMSVNYRHLLFKNICLDLNSLIIGYDNIHMNKKRFIKFGI